MGRRGAERESGEKAQSIAAQRKTGKDGRNQQASSQSARDHGWEIPHGGSGRQGRQQRGEQHHAIHVGNRGTTVPEESLSFGPVDATKDRISAPPTRDRASGACGSLCSTFCAVLGQVDDVELQLWRLTGDAT